MLCTGGEDACIVQLKNHLAPVPRGEECYIKGMGILVVGFGASQGVQRQKVDSGSFCGTLRVLSRNNMTGDIVLHSKWFEPRSISSSYSVIVRVNVMCYVRIDISNVPVKSKLQHPPRGNPQGI